MFKIYNTLSRKKEVFKPRRGRIVNLFVCGITPYDFAHIGHARTYIVFDMIVKYLREKGYDVFYLQNITDIDDKIIKRAKEKKVSVRKIARDFEKEYLKDMKTLKIDSVTRYARATDHIKEIISQVERLLKKGYAYQIKDGIYYDISKFKNYGKLSRRTVLQAEDAVSRIDEAKEKRNKGDFCLWKLSKKGEPAWSSPWDKGRPGWHIEDTAITEKFFGPQYDIHGGAKDLIFPHHEAEIAQMEAISGKKPMVKYWLHSGFLTVRGQKMAKSLGNFITIRDFLKKHSPRLLRLLVLKTHYRSPIDYNENIILQSKRELERIDEFIDKIQNAKCKMQNYNSKFKISKFQKQFDGAMEDDFNTPKALASLFELINKGNSLIDENRLTRDNARDILEFLEKIDRIFNFIFWQKPKEKIPQKLLNLVKQREEYRKKGNWKSADEIRKKIKEMGWWIEDTKEGPKVKRISNF
jgi:cysteinyl-tRNA synthetase